MLEKKEKITHTNKIKFNFVRVGGTQAIYKSSSSHENRFRDPFSCKEQDSYVFKTRCIFGIYPHVKRKTHVSGT